MAKDRKQSFPGNTVQHRQHTLTDIGSSTKYIGFLKTLYETTSYKIAVVPNEMEGRPDLISMGAYNTSDLWWVIVQANNAFDYEVDFKAGVSIIIPQI